MITKPLTYYQNTTIELVALKESIHMNLSGYITLT